MGRLVTQEIGILSHSKRFDREKTKVGEVGKRLFPIFRDREELPTSNELGLAIKTALDESSHLIVVCSPNSANSTWVNEEIKYFKSLGRSDNILSFIVDGNRMSPLKVLTRIRRFSRGTEISS